MKADASRKPRGSASEENMYSKCDQEIAET